MILYRELEYFGILKQKINNCAILSVSNLSIESILSKSREIGNALFPDKTLFKLCKDRYSLGGETLVNLNSLKFYLWNDNFCNNQEHKDKFVRSATYYVLFCCLIDKILDSKTVSNDKKSLVLTQFNRDCYELILNGEYPGLDYGLDYMEVDDILNTLAFWLSNSFKYLKKFDAEQQKKIIENALKAYDSEFYVSTSRLVTPDSVDISLLTNKATCFVQSAFQMGAFDAINKTHMDEVAYSIAKLFWFTDDICDLYEDIRDERKNSLLFAYSPTFYSIESAIDRIIYNIDDYFEYVTKCLLELKNELSEELYMFILAETWDWLVSINKNYSKAYRHLR